MAQTFKPVEGEAWQHPVSRTRYYIHSVTDDGWVRYYQHGLVNVFPLWTRPLLTFTQIYVRVEPDATEPATEPATNIVPNGTQVRYHGSLTGYHGPMTVEASHDEYVPTHGEYSPVRYVLRYGSGMYDRLHNVRPESFTPVDSNENGHV